MTEMIATAAHSMPKSKKQQPQFWDILLIASEAYVREQLFLLTLFNVCRRVAEKEEKEN